MSLERAGSGATMLSRAWSTSDLGRGLTHILTDGKNELPDDLAQLEELEKMIADIEAVDQGEVALAELMNVNTVATPQRREDPGLPNVAEPERHDTVPASDEDVKGSAAGSPSGDSTLRVASPPSPASSLPPSASRVGESDVMNRIVTMWQSGTIDANVAMQLLGQGLSPNESPPVDGGKGATPAGDNGLPQKRPADSITPSVAPADLDDVLEQAKKAKMEENALKAKLRRLCEIKANGKCNVPDWLHQQWKHGDHMAMALQFQRCNFDKDAFIKYTEKTTTKKDTTTNDLEFGWYSKDDMVKVLKWNTKKIEGAIKCCERDPKNLIRRCKYGGEDEYHVDVRETGKHKQSNENAESTVERTQGDDKSELQSVTLERLDLQAARNAAATSAPVVEASEACRAKEVFRKFVDSVLQKSARVRSLTVDLKKNYYEDETAMKAVEALEGNLKTLGQEYNSLSDHMAKGEQEDFSPEWSVQSEKVMKASTFVCTRVSQNEAKVRNAKRHFKKVQKEPKQEEAS